MADENPRNRSKPDPEPEIGAADLLFRDGPAVTSPKYAPNSSAAPGSGARRRIRPGRTTRISRVDSDEPHPTPSVRASERASPQAARAQGRTARGSVPPRPVSPGRGGLVQNGRMGPNTDRGGWLGGHRLLFVYFLRDLLSDCAFLVLLLGGAVAVVLSYPILITLERPVRITPEQAVRDYCAALSHHLPHFKRMWLLLSTAGRVSTAFGSFEGFKAYWKDRLGRLREGHAGSMTPLVFMVADFKAEKSAGMTRVDADFTVKVLVRGQRQAGPIHTFPMRIALVRGPDKMWYLEDGTLARRERAMKSSDT